MNAVTKGGLPAAPDTATCTPDSRPARRGSAEDVGLGSAHTPDQPSTRSKYHVFECVMPS